MRPDLKNKGLERKTSGRPPSAHNAQVALQTYQTNVSSGRALCPFCGGSGKNAPDLYYDCPECEGSGIHAEGNQLRP